MEWFLLYKFVDYEEDFHNDEANDKNTKLLTSDYQLQTTINHPQQNENEQY